MEAQRGLGQGHMSSKWEGQGSCSGLVFPKGSPFSTAPHGLLYIINDKNGLVICICEIPFTDTL